MSVDMLNLSGAILLVVPSGLIAYRSIEGSRAGYFLLYLWIVEALIYGFLGLAAFICGLFVAVLIAYLFRRKLKLTNFWSNQSNLK